MVCRPYSVLRAGDKVCWRYSVAGRGRHGMSPVQSGGGRERPGKAYARVGLPGVGIGRLSARPGPDLVEARHGCFIEVKLQGAGVVGQLLH